MGQACRYVLVGIAALILLPLWLPIILILNLFGGLCFPIAFTSWWASTVPGASWQQGDITEEQWQKVHGEAPIVETMPEPNEVIQFDFIDPESPVKKAKGPLRVVTYNVFLAQNLQGVIDELKSMSPRPDVILLQEDNIYTDSTVSPPVFRYAGGAVAEALGMAVCFSAAYKRNKPVTGCYGNSIMSLVPFEDTPTALPSRNRPRLVTSMPFINGHRHFPVCQVRFEGWSEPLKFVSVHLPSVGPNYGGINMLKAALEDLATNNNKDSNKPAAMGPVIIAGDFNTLPFVMRYLPFARTDLFFSCVTEQQRMRRVVEHAGLVDPFSDKEGTYVHMLGVCKVDWLVLDEQHFTVVNKTVEDHNKPETRASDHLWAMVDLAPPSSVKAKKEPSY